MSVRLVISISAAKGKGAEFAAAFKPRCEQSRQDAGCLQFELFQSVFDPDKFTLLELWESPEALAAHAKLQAARPPLPEGLRLGGGEREDYTYNRTR
jgi:quinol monooxygenase YgiN